jgi:hypothetical protein
MKQIKVPKEVMEVLYESEACLSLSNYYARGWFPSVKALYYGTKATKAERLAWRALGNAHPETTQGSWRISTVTGLATKDEPAILKEKKPRVPRKPKAVSTTPAAPAAKEGEVK